MCDLAKAVLETIYSFKCLLEEKKLKIKNLTPHFNSLKMEELLKSKISKRRK